MDRLTDECVELVDHVLTRHVDPLSHAASAAAGMPFCGIIRATHGLNQREDTQQRRPAKDDSTCSGRPGSTDAPEMGGRALMGQQKKAIWTCPSRPETTGALGKEGIAHA